MLAIVRMMRRLHMLSLMGEPNHRERNTMIDKLSTTK
jgi:hypothetical protein